MRDYGPPPENQTELVIPGVNDAASKDWEDARQWTCLHFSEWCYYKEHADAHRDKNGKASPNACLNAMRERFMQTPVRITAHWHEGRKPGSRQFRARDRDNIRFGMKFIQDALVAEGIIDDDAFDKVDPHDTYTKDKDDPHVVVVIEEVEET